MEACLPRRSRWAAVPSIRSRSMATTALITGGTSGIGRATANKLAQLGVHVVVVGRNVDRGEKTIAEIRKAGGQADFIPSDLRDASSARVAARKALEVTNGQVDILVNNAGVYPFGPTHEMTHPTDFVDQALARKKLERRIALRAPFLSAARILAASDMISVLPRRIVDATAPHHSL